MGIRLLTSAATAFMVAMHAQEANEAFQEPHGRDNHSVRAGLCQDWLIKHSRTCVTDFFELDAKVFQFLRRQRTDRPPEVRTGKFPHEPARCFHPLMRAAAGLAEIINNPRQRRDRLLSPLSASQITIQCRMDKLDHELWHEPRETDQRAVGGL